MAVASAATGGRQCLFCGDPSARSREHAFPNWLNGVLLEADAGPSVAERFAVADGAPTLTSWTTDAAAKQTVRKVCGKCNNGWMAELESKAKPLLSPMIKGQAQSLDRAAQLLVATWAMKTFVVLDEAVGTTHQVSETSRRLLKEEERPPEDSWVFISGIESSIGPLRFTHAAAHTEQLDGEAAHFDVYTLQMGALVIQGVVTDISLSASDRWGSEKSPTFPAELERLDFETSLFPPRLETVTWPSPKLLYDARFLQYVQRMRGGEDSPFPPDSRFATG